MENLRNDKRNGKQFAYILDSINHEGNDSEKLTHFFQCFSKEYKKDLTKLEYPDYFVNHVAEYLKTQPICCTVAVTNASIKEIGSKWGINGGRTREVILYHWFKLLAHRLCVMRRILIKETFNKGTH